MYNFTVVHNLIIWTRLNTFSLKTKCQKLGTTSKLTLPQALPPVLNPATGIPLLSLSEISK